MVRGVSYSSDEDAALAGCWLAVSSEHSEQDSISFWSSVAESYSKQPETIEYARTPSSLQSRWHTLQRLVQKYLASERIYMSQPQPSGTTPEETRVNVMKLYCRRTQKPDKDRTMKDGPPLKSLSAVAILRQCPKFSATGGSSRTCPNYLASSAILPPKQLVQNDCTETTGTDTSTPNVDVSGTRPLGVKKLLRKKAVAEKQNGLTAIASALKESTRRKEVLKRAQLRFSVINALPDGEMKTKYLLELLQNQELLTASNSADPQSRVSISSLISDE